MKEVEFNPKESYIIQMLDAYHELFKRSGTPHLYYSYLYANGKLFTNAADNKIKTPKFVNRQVCYWNSLKASLKLDLVYYEGLFCTEEIELPLSHAFNTERGCDLVIDFTERVSGYVVTEWYGVEVPKIILEEFIVSKYNEILTPYTFYLKKLMDYGEIQ